MGCLAFLLLLRLPWWNHLARMKHFARVKDLSRGGQGRVRIRVYVAGPYCSVVWRGDEVDRRVRSQWWLQLGLMSTPGAYLEFGQLSSLLAYM